MTSINQTTVPNLILAATFSPLDNTQYSVLGVTIELPADFTLYAVANVVAGADWAAFGGKKSNLQVGALTGQPTFTVDGSARMGGGALVSGLALLRVTRTGGLVEMQVTGGTSLQANIGVTLAKIDTFGACPLTRLFNTDPAIRHLFNAIIGRAIALDSAEDILIREWIKDTLGAEL